MTRGHPSPSPRLGSGNMVRLCSSLLFRFSLLLLKVQAAPMLPPGCSPCTTAPCSHLTLLRQLQNHPWLSPPPSPLYFSYSLQSGEKLYWADTPPSRCHDWYWLNDQILTLTKTREEALTYIQLLPFSPLGRTVGKWNYFWNPMHLSPPRNDLPALFIHILYHQYYPKTPSRGHKQVVCVGRTECSVE